ncbi:MAG: hypothetical protein ACLQIH_15635 [Myxococcaceae bacterium]
MSVGTPFSELCGTLEALRQLAAVWNGGPRIEHFGAQLGLDRLGVLSGCAGTRVHHHERRRVFGTR